jgi:exopolysaccharide production protein ExoQ
VEQSCKARLWGERGLAWLLFLLPGLAVLFPQGTAPALVLAALLAAPTAWAERRRPLPWGRLLPAAFFLLIAALGLLWMQQLWSAAGFKLLRLTAVLLLAAVLLRAAPALPRATLRFFPQGYLLAVAAMVLIALGGRPLHHFLMMQGVLAPGPRGVLDLSFLNRGATTLILFFWPLLLLLWSRGYRRLLLPLPAIALAALVLLSSNAALAGLGLGLLLAALTWQAPRLGRGLLWLIVVVLLLAMPLAAEQLYAWGWQQAAWLPFSAQHRVHLWRFVAARIAERPLFGWGFDASPHMAFQASDLFRPWLKQAIPLHPHNAGLQILLETGLAGALAILGFLAASLRSFRAPKGVAALTYGLSATALAIAGSAFGLWQNQWLAVLFLSFFLLRLAREGGLTASTARA